jgi:hypothetical protein
VQLAYIILAHKNPLQLRRLLLALHDGETNPSFFVHIDKNVPRAQWEAFRRVLGELRHLDIAWVEREKGEWGELGIVRATINGLRSVLGRSRQYDHVLLLSGMDYPIKSNADIRRFLTQHRGKNLIQHIPLTADAAPDRVFRIAAYHFKVWGKSLYYPSASRRLQRKLLDWALLLPLRFPSVRRFPAYVRPYTGSQWWCLTPRAAAYICEFLDRHPDYLAYHQDSLLPDEMFFQSILLGSTGSGLEGSFVNGNLTYLEWRVPHPRPAGYTYAGPAVFTAADFDALMRVDNKLFARKFDIEKDGEIFDLIDQKIKPLPE